MIVDKTTTQQKTQKEDYSFDGSISRLKRKKCLDFLLTLILNVNQFYYHLKKRNSISKEYHQIILNRYDELILYHLNIDREQPFQVRKEFRKNVLS